MGCTSSTAVKPKSRNPKSNHKRHAQQEPSSQQPRVENTAPVVDPNPAYQQPLALTPSKDSNIIIRSQSGTNPTTSPPVNLNASLEHTPSQDTIPPAPAKGSAELAEAAAQSSKGSVIRNGVYYSESELAEDDLLWQPSYWTRDRIGKWVEDIDYPDGTFNDVNKFIHHKNISIPPHPRDAPILHSPSALPSSTSHHHQPSSLNVPSLQAQADKIKSSNSIDQTSVTEEKTLQVSVPPSPRNPDNYSDESPG